MKMKKRAAVAATVFSVALNLSACVYGPPYDPADNHNVNVYGPPEEIWEYEEEHPSETYSENDSTEEVLTDE